MLKPDQIHNKAGAGKDRPAGSAAPIAHPTPAVCPRCGRQDAVALPAEAATPTRYVVRCACGTFTWDTGTNTATLGEDS